jgi:signal transduction histidine kinase
VNVRDAVPHVVAAVLTIGVGLAELSWRATWDSASVSPVFVLLMAAAVGTARFWPGLALGVVWLTGLAQLTTGTPLLFTELLALYVAFAGARWGGRVVLVLSGVSIPVGVLVGAVPLVLGYYSPGILVSRLRELFDLVGVSVLTALPLAFLGLVAAWLAGLALRFQDNAATSRREQREAERESARAHRETAQAYEIARLRDEQTRLARDVHDVVGHSLAVILAQAESGQFLRDDDPVALKSTLATIAGTARSSLQDVQGVLSATPVPPGRLQALVDGARETGFAIEDSSTGQQRALPPELAAVAYRVLQELLTNALKHGDRAVPVVVVQRWPDGRGEELELFVANGVSQRGGTSGGGRGLDGMHRRLEAVGGRLHVDARTPGRFAVTARIPVRS